MIALIELSLFSALFAGCFFNARKVSAAIALLAWFYFCAVMALIGYQKSAYHLLLVILTYYAILKIHWGASSKTLLKYLVVVQLCSLSTFNLINADSALQSKTAAPQFFWIWPALLLLAGARGKYLKILAITFILLDILVSVSVSARGVLIGSMIALFFSAKSFNQRGTVLVGILLASFSLYVVVIPYFLLYGGHDFIQETASNSQRSLMNIASLINVFNNFITLDENAVFDVVSEYQYSYDSSSLTVHNLFLSFGLFNGLFPAVILLTVVMAGIRRLSGTGYLPIGFFMYFLMLLGPDSFATRYALLLLVALVAISHGRLQPNCVRKLTLRGRGHQNGGACIV